jgi:hypothetical protein
MPLEKDTPTNKIRNMKNCTISNRIVQLLDQYPKGLTAYGIADILGIHRETAKAKIKYLLKKGRIGGFRLKKRIKYFTLKNLVLNILDSCTEFYPNQRKISKKLFMQKAEKMPDNEIKEKLDQIGKKYGSLQIKKISELTPEEMKKAVIGIIDIFYKEN